MKKLTTLLMTLLLMSTMLWADETITVTANSSDISEGLDLKVVAKLFAEAKNLEEFETMLNNPDSAYCNLDLNGDGQVDYLRVVETGEGNKRLVVLQAVLAKDIYQDVASIYVEKDEKDEVSIQVIGDEYVYGTAYILEPVYVYRPLIYDWFWSDAWYAWHSPWYWGYYPSWWYVHSCWAHDWYWHHCYAYHHHHYCCSFRYAHHPHEGYRDMHHSVSHRDYATVHPDRSFERRNSGVTNAREIRNANAVEMRRGDATRRPDSEFRRDIGGSPREVNTHRDVSGSTRSTATTSTRSTATTNRQTATTTRTTDSSTRSTATTTRTTNTTTRTTNTTTRPTSTTTRSTSSVNTPVRTTNERVTHTTGSPSRSGNSSSTYTSSRSSGSSSSSSRSGGGFSSGGSRGGSVSSGGGSRGGSVSSGGGGARTRR